MVLQQRWLLYAGLLCCGVVFAGATPAVAARTTRTKPAKHVVELKPWELAERGREQFEAIPEATRTKADYTAAMDAFRAVYHQSPQEVHAASAVYSVAELL